MPPKKKARGVSSSSTKALQQAPPPETKNEEEKLSDLEAFEELMNNAHNDFVEAFQQSATHKLIQQVGGIVITLCCGSRC